MATVTVACSFPNGIVLQCWELVDGFEGSPTGPKACKVARRYGPAITINGPRPFRGTDLQHLPRPMPPMQGKFALTHNVDADLWARWLEQNRDLELVVNGLIFAFDSSKRDHIVGTCKDHKHLRTGFEAIDPNNIKSDARLPRPLPGTSVIATASEGNQPTPQEDEAA